MKHNVLKIDGSHGEGGGQIIRTALTLSSITSTPIEIYNIRGGREQPGLRPQHVACVKAAAEICSAEVEGNYTGSEHFTFRPGSTIRAGDYQWKINTAGAATLVLQTVLLPLALAPFSSSISITGGTHVPNSPSGHYLRDVYAPMLVQSGADILIELHRVGWFPQGGGEILAQIAGRAQLKAQQLTERGDLERIFGTGLATNLPAHIPQRLTDRVLKGLNSLDQITDIRPQITKGISTGAGVFLTAEYTNGRAGFGVIGKKGISSEDVASNAAKTLLSFHRSRACVDPHLADQILLIMALAHGESCYTTSRVTSHLETNSWIIQQFLQRPISIDAGQGLIRIAR